MLFVGTARNEDVWAAFVDVSVFDDESYSPPPAGFSSGSSVMKYDTYLKALVFFAYLFHREGIEDVYLRERHPDDISRVRELAVFTNLMYVQSLLRPV